MCRHATNETGLSVTITTHAHWLDEALADVLKEHVHFLRISMDGVGTTYESLRKRPFAALIHSIATVSARMPFGINFVVNAQTFPDLDAAIEIASKAGAAEFLLLPEQPVHGRGGIDTNTTHALQRWVNTYRGNVPLSVSEAGSDGLPVCFPVTTETGLRAYAHIDASGIIKRSSYDNSGVAIDKDGVIRALDRLRAQSKERAP